MSRPLGCLGCLGRFGCFGCFGCFGRGAFLAVGPHAEFVHEADVPAVEGAQAGEQDQALGLRVEAVFANAPHEHAANGRFPFDLLQVVGRSQAGGVDEHLVDAVRRIEGAGGEVVRVEVEAVRLAGQPDARGAGQAGEGGGDALPGVVGTLRVRQVDVQAVERGRPRLEPAGRHAAVPDLQDRGAAPGAAEGELLERAESGPVRTVGRVVGVADDGVVEAGGGDLGALERSVPVLTLEGGVPLLAVEHGDVDAGVIRRVRHPEPVVEEAGRVDRLAVRRAPDRDPLAEALAGEVRLAEDVDVVRPVDPPVGAIAGGGVVIPRGGEDREAGPFEGPAQERDRVRRDELVFEEVAADQHRGGALVPGLLERPGHAVAQPLALPARRLARRPAELRVQVNVAEGEELHRPAPSLGARIARERPAGVPPEATARSEGVGG